MRGVGLERGREMGLQVIEIDKTVSTEKLKYRKKFTKTFGTNHPKIDLISEIYCIELK